MQWNANGNIGKITELLTFLHSNNVNIAAIQETRLTNQTKSPKTPGWAAVRLDHHKNKGGGLLMLIKGYQQMAGQLRSTSVWPPMTSRYYQTGQSKPHWPAIICPSSSPSTPRCPRLMGSDEPNSTSARHAEACESRTVKQAETFMKAVNKASGLIIPAGRIPRIQPTMPASAKSFAFERGR